MNSRRNSPHKKAPQTNKGASLKLNKREVNFLIIILAASLLIRIFRLSQSSIWLDEAHTIWIARLPLNQLIELVSKYEVHPHLYYVFIHFWIKVFGIGEFALRMPSVIAGVMEVWFVFLIAGELFDVKTGLYAAAFTGFSNFEILYSQEVRMYSFLLLSTAMIAYTFLKAVKTGDKKYWFAYVLASLFGIYTDYRAILIIAGCNLFVLIFNSKFRDRLKGMFISAGAVFAASIPIIPVFLHQSGPDGGGRIIRIFYEKINLFIVLKTFFSFMGGFILPLSRIPVMIISALILLLALGGIWLSAMEKKKYSLYLPVVFLFSYIIFMIYSAFVVRIYSINNLIFLSPIFIILIISTLVKLGEKNRGILITALALFLIVNLYANYLWFFDSVYTKQNFRAAVNYLSMKVKPDDRIVVVPQYQQYPFNYYFNKKNRVFFVDPRDLENKNLREELTQPVNYWWVFAADNFIDPEGRSRKWLDEHYRINSAIQIDFMKFHNATGTNIQIYSGTLKK